MKKNIFLFIQLYLPQPAVQQSVLELQQLFF